MSQRPLWSAVSLAAIAIAQAVPAMAEEIRNEIVVTSIKDTGEDALGVTVLERSELEARQFQDLSTLSYTAPNVSLDPIGTFKGVANFSIRGLGINSSIPSIDPSVGIFVDGVYMGINAGTVFDALDVERVDILRGPQGVAFGRNTTGGAVLVRTGDPSWEWQGHARAGIEVPVDHGRGGPMVSLRSVVSGPLSDSIAIRLGALYSDDSGYFRNSFDGADFGAARTTVLRGAIAFRPATSFTLTVKGEWTGSDGDGAATHNNGQNPRDEFRLSINQPGFYDSESGFVTAKAELELGQGKLTNVFGWRQYDLSTRNDIDSSPEKIFESDTFTAQEQWSNELYYAADYGMLTLTAGGYLFHQDVGYEETRDLSAFGSPTSYGGGRQDHDVYGLYGQADLNLGTGLVASAGLRWSREEKEAAITYVRPRAPCSAIDASCPVTGENAPGENNGFTDERSWSNLSPRLALAYEGTAGTRLEASWTRGYRSGGYNLRITQPQAFEQVAAGLGTPSFDEERVDTYELGGAWQSSDGLARISAAAYWTEVAGLQREINVPSASSGLAQSVYNTADARILGGEVEAAINPAPALQLAAHLGYTDADYREVFFDINSDGVIDSADRDLELPRVPKWSFGGSLNYYVELGGMGRLTANGFYQHRSRYAYTDNNWGYNSASDRLDASLALAVEGTGLTVTLYGRNLLDQLQFGGDTQLPFAGGPYSDGDNEPFDPAPAAGTFSPLLKGRSVGLELSAQF